MTTTSSTTSTPSTTNTGASIISALGTGSGIDTASLVDKLVSVNKMADQDRITTRQTLLQTQISDLGLLRSSFTKLETAASGLANPDSFNAKSVSVPTTTLFSISKLDASAAVGSYSIGVEQLAKAQSLSSGEFTSQTAAIGKGTLAIRFGDWNDAGTAFTPDTTKTGGTITIDDSNNSLTGVRDAINKANLGITASIVSDSGKFKLLVSSPSGATNEVEITAADAPGSTGLAQFNFNQTARNLTQQQAGMDAKIRVNGLLLSRPTNHISDVVQGMEFDLANTSTTETVSVGVVADKTLGEKAIRDFVAAYNTFLGESGKLVGFDKDKNANGSLSQDPLAKNLLQQVRNQLNAPVQGLTGTFTSFSNLGIHTELDGTLTIDDSATSPTSFRSAIDNNFNAVRDLFVAKSTSSNAQIAVTKNTANSVPGTYDVKITQVPTKGKLTAGTVTSLDTTGKTLTFTAGVDGINASPITLPSKVYASGAELAADIQTRINSDAAIVAGKVSVNVLFNSTTQQLEFTSASYGSGSKIQISASSADMATIGISDATGSAGADVGGTVGGVAAFGYGNVLLPAIGSKAEGLSMTVDPGVSIGTTSSIAFSRGFAGAFTSLIDNFMQSNGLLKTHETSINQDIDKTKTDQTALDKRSDAYKARLQAQFSAMESIVRSLKSTGTFLTGAFKALSANSSS